MKRRLILLCLLPFCFAIAALQSVPKPGWYAADDVQLHLVKESNGTYTVTGRYFDGQAWWPISGNASRSGAVKATINKNGREIPLDGYYHPNTDGLGHPDIWVKINGGSSSSSCGLANPATDSIKGGT